MDENNFNKEGSDVAITDHKEPGCCDVDYFTAGAVGTVLEYDGTDYKPYRVQVGPLTQWVTADKIKPLVK